MRADRLLALLLLLQTHGRMTAGDLARELEVSERTIYRDLDALGAAGVPVYTERGPGGGCALLDSYRTSLTGLTDGEVRALFMLSQPSPLADLEVGRDLKAALRKLSAALPAGRQDQEAWLRQRLHLDWSGSAVASRSPHLAALQRAAWEDRRVRVAYRRDDAPHRPTFERTVDPYGLVAHASEWYVMWGIDSRVQAFPVAGLLAVETLAEAFLRPPGFDLAAVWAAWRDEQEVAQHAYKVRALVAVEAITRLPLLIGVDADAVPVASEGGWAAVTLTFASLEDARARLLALGGAVEILTPLPLRLSLADFARQAAARYEGQPSAAGNYLRGSR